MLFVTSDIWYLKTKKIARKLYKNYDINLYGLLIIGSYISLYLIYAC